MVLGIAANIEQLQCRFAHGLLNRAACLERLERDIADVKPALVVVDTLQNMLSVADVNNYGEVGAAMRPLQRIVRESNAHFVGLMHANKQHNSLSIEAMLGSMQWVASVDVAIGMMSSGSGIKARRFIEVTKCRPLGDDPFGRTEVVLDANGRLVLPADTDQISLNEVVEIVRSLTEDGPVSFTKIRDKLKGKNEKRRGAVDAAVAAGLVAVHEGQYSVLESE
jgi:hypothetical protein